MITVLAVLVATGTLPVWVVVVIFAREFLITGVRAVAANQGVVLTSTLGGKSKTLTQNLMIGALILSRPYPPFRPVAAVMVAVALIATISSGLDYLWRYRRFVL